MDCDSDSKFKRACDLKFQEFLKTSEDYRHEMDKLKLMLLLDANLFFFMNDQESQLMEKVLKAPSIETLLIIGGLGITYAKQHLSSV